MTNTTALSVPPPLMLGRSILTTTYIPKKLGKSVDIFDMY
jgi:hypothetical protein